MKNNKNSCLIFLLVISSIIGCSKVDQETILRQKIDDYFQAWNNQNFSHPDFAKFKRDTSYTWHGKKEGKGIRSIFNPNSGWKQWDRAWNGTYTYEIKEIDLEAKKVMLDFQETTDFLKYIGMPEGFKAVVSFWFDDDLRVKETLYDWDPNNKDIDDGLQPIVEWAKENDSIRINSIYLSKGFKADSLNAVEWKQLFQAYDKRSEE